MHWMTEGDWYHISYNDFASRFSFGTADAHRPRLHIHSPLDKNEIKLMYAPGIEGNVGTINGLYTFYSVLNRLFRKTICPRDGDPTNISQFIKNLLANMRDGVPSFSVMDFVWEEIKDITMNPRKTCGFASYLMFIIENVTVEIFQRKASTCPSDQIPPRSLSYLQFKSPLLLEQILLLSNSKQHKNRSDQLVIPIRPVGLNRDSLQASSERNHPPL
jgi:hypothetical protein